MVLAIQAKNLKIGYMDEEEQITWATRGVDLSVEEGESFCIVGESGCGKSTLASAIAGVLPPHALTMGKLYIFNQLVINESERNYNGIRGKVVSLIPQNPGTSLNPFLTIGDHFYYILRDVKGLSKSDSIKIAQEYLSKVGLGKDVLEKYPHKLSGGMQQRVLIAIALASEVKIIVADEPTSSIDANLRAQILNLLSKLVKEFKVTLLLVTHDLASASKICDRIAVMYAGKVIETGLTSSIISKPRHPYTRMLLDSVPLLGSKKSLNPLPGEPPSLVEDFTWCSFRDRCPFRIEQCSVEPPLIPVEDEPHLVRCWRFREVS
ncbi:MAG: ABC transporter ATP-binding protein [Desulfurococcaceae archaeon]